MELIRTLRLKVRPEAYPWLNKAAYEVNQVWNWANANVYRSTDRCRRVHPKRLTGFDLCKLGAGASPYFEGIGSDTIQRICNHIPAALEGSKKRKLTWRASGGRRRALGWIPFKGASLTRRKENLRFASKTIRVFNREYLGDHRFRFRPWPDVSASGAHHGARRYQF